jgi:hypothetical protein
MATAAAAEEGEGEDVHKLEYGGVITPETTVLSNDGALYLLSMLKRDQHTDTIQQAFDYLRLVSTTTDTNDARVIHQQVMTELESMMLGNKAIDGEGKLEKFEMAALVNLVKEDSDIEEVKAWIPTLLRFDQNHVMQAVNIVKEAKARYTASGYND